MSAIHTFNLKGKVVLITGGYGYLGKSISESLLHHGATVYILGRSLKKYSNTFKDISNPKLNLAKCDVLKTEEIKSAFKNIYDKSSTLFGEREGEAILIIAKYQYEYTFVLEKEICIAAMLNKLLNIC